MPNTCAATDCDNLLNKTKKYCSWSCYNSQRTVSSDKIKTCPECGISGKSDDLFYFIIRKTGPRSGQKLFGTFCKECQKNKVREYRENNPEKIKESQRNARLKSNYDLTPDEWARMAEDQERRCAICCRIVDRLCVDHNHDTGEVRGLLCIICNHRILGASKDNPDILERAVIYLRGGGWEALKNREWLI